VPRLVSRVQTPARCCYIAPVKRISYLATAAKGTEDLLVEELEELGAEEVAAGRGLVRFKGDVELGWKANLWLRTAMRVLRPIADFPAPSPEALYEGMRGINWTELVTPQTTIAVEGSVKDSAMTHSHFASLKAKDAIVDMLRDELGARPSVDTEDPAVPVVLRIDRDHAYVSLNMSGDALFKRGYRVRSTAAPIKETLAAALILSTTWGGRRPFIDPMCGSGTIAIEAALIAARRAPGRWRNFAFQRWPSWGQTQIKRWKEILAEADAESLDRSPGPILASDAAGDAIEAAQANAQSAKVFDSIRFQRRDVRATAPTMPPGIVLTNPPYGERIGGRGEDLPSLYAGMGERFREMRGHDIYVLAAAKDPAYGKAIGMEPVESTEFWNGPIETALHHYFIE